MFDVQSSFVSGEISPKASARIDVAKFKTGLETCRNFIPDVHGPVSNRPGTYFIASTKDSTKRAIVVPFISSTQNAYVLEFGNLYIRFYKDGAQIPATEVTTTYLESDLSLLKFAQSADTLYIAHQSYAPAQLQRTDDTTWTLSAYAFTNGPFQFPNTDTSIQMKLSLVFGPDPDAGQLTSNTAYFNADMVGAIFQLEFPISGNSYIADLTTLTTSDTLYCGNTWRLVTTGTWTGKITVYRNDGTGIHPFTATTVATYKSNNDLNVNTFGSVDLVDGIVPVPVYVTFDISSGTCHATFTTDNFTQRVNVKATGFLSATVLDIDFLGDNTSILLNTYTSSWSEGSWSPYRGWPATVSFHQDRLCWAATPTEPQTEWMTKSGNYVDFNVSDPLSDDDSIGLNLLSRQQNPIRSLVSYLQSLISFTDFSEWDTSATDGGGITPTNAFSKLQGTRGIGDIDPIIVGSRIIFTSPRGSTVREMQYQYLNNVFDTTDIGILSSHLFEGYTIVSMAYQQEPHSILWFVRSDGTLLSLTYEKEQEVLGWARHDTDGTFESVCVIPGDDGDEVWFVVNRDGGRFVERMLKRTTSTAPEDQYFVDAGISYDGVAITHLTGLDHLEGKTVSIVADGVIVPEQTVISGGITLTTAASKIVCGLPYTCDLFTLRPEVQLPDGTMQGRKYGISECIFRFLNSAGGFAGSDSDHLDEIDVRDESVATGDPTPLFTGFYPITLAPNDDLYAQIFFRQTDPMPVTILAITAIIDPGQVA